MKGIFQTVLVALAGITFLATSSCKREYDSPPERIIPIGQILTIDSLRSLHQGESVRFDDDFSVYATVTADEASGNLYRNIHIEDATGAIVLRLNNPGGLYEGDSVRVYLPGTVLSVFQGMMQLDSVSVDNNIIKQATQRFRQPTTLALSEINPQTQSKLIRLENVEFAASELGNTYADAINQSSQNRILTDCNGNSIIVRTSGFANFANQQIPGGNGSLIAVVGQFNNDMQLFIRRASEVNLTGERCDGSSGGGDCDYNVSPVQGVVQDFNDVTSDNTDYLNPQWLNINEQGNRFWRGRISTQSGQKYLRATGFAGQGVSVPPTEIWFITPPVQTSAGPAMYFESAQAFWTHSTDDPFRVFISTDYDGCEISDANWTEITNFTKPSSSSGNYQWIQSGTINLTPYLPQGYDGTYHVGFMYYSEGTQTTTIDIDNINIQ